MKKFIKQTIIFAGMLFLSLTCSDYDQGHCIKFYGNEVFVPNRLGAIELYKDFSGFHVFKDGETYDIQNCFCDPLLRQMTDEQLENFLGRNNSKIIMLTPEEFDRVIHGYVVKIRQDEIDKRTIQLFNNGYILVNQMNDGEYILHAKIRCPSGVKDGTVEEIVRDGVRAVGGGAVVAGTGAAVAIGGTAVVGGVAYAETAAVLTLACGGQYSLISGFFTAAEVFGGIAVTPVMITVGVGYLGYLGYRGISWLAQSSEEPSAPRPNVETPDVHADGSGAAVNLDEIGVKPFRDWE